MLFRSECCQPDGEINRLKSKQRHCQIRRCVEGWQGRQPKKPSPLTPEKTNMASIDERWDSEFQCSGLHSLKGAPLGKIEPIHMVNIIGIGFMQVSSIFFCIFLSCVEGPG